MENLKEMSSLELLEFNGGHNGAAYEIGRALGKALIMASCIAFFFMPKDYLTITPRAFNNCSWCI